VHYFFSGGRRFYRRGRWIKVCGLVNAWYETVDDPEELIRSLKADSHGSHLFTFFQRVPHISQEYPYRMEPYSVSVIELTNYDDWWKNCIGKKTRQMVKKAAKKDVEIRTADFDDDFIKGIHDIYSETPVRAGKIFPHYEDSLETVRKENGTFLDRSVFLGAYHQGELIGFTKIVFEDEFADILQHLSKMSHRDKCSTNALLAKAVELCAARGMRYIAYGDWDSSGIGDFKRHNGFVRMDLPRYYIPLNWMGSVALGFKLHRPVSRMLPGNLLRILKNLRSMWYERTLKGSRSDHNDLS